MSIFRRDFEKLEVEQRKKEEREEGLRELKEAKLSNKDILALIISMFKLVAPFAVIVLCVYFFIILFLTKVWS
ncbi:hypothetical protein ACQPUL_10485 [Clostridium butyricum]|uniref:hypothetical protein n=1 Tax=Clostridium butyricum TaxID=1492 RepID=UPI00071B667A|nr:hypothetical protein [Clostridium butyricum]MDU4854557.1 hypothetical protein [Clostridioides difficile]ALP88739.1 hypothetical protein ATN24_00530 [Clostridium butyricum]ALS18344.1 hypothetical protein ATD26_16140 [Clostridium butyricum]ANF15469.1 hypothetical protein AZ909_15880 [Clostridium butyricum]AOR95417.1 hypothetical protein BBB49_15490 [Clostridium butyricum]